MPTGLQCGFNQSITNNPLVISGSNVTLQNIVFHNLDIVAANAVITLQDCALFDSTIIAGDAEHIYNATGMVAPGITSCEKVQLSLDNVTLKTSDAEVNRERHSNSKGNKGIHVKCPKTIICIKNSLILSRIISVEAESDLTFHTVNSVVSEPPGNSQNMGVSGIMLHIGASSAISIVKTQILDLKFSHSQDALLDHIAAVYIAQLSCPDKKNRTAQTTIVDSTFAGNHYRPLLFEVLAECPHEAIIRNCSFTGNHVFTDGAAIMVLGTAAPSLFRLRISGSRFYDNVAGDISMLDTVSKNRAFLSFIPLCRFSQLPR